MKMMLLRHFDFDDPSAVLQWAGQAGCEAAIRDPAEGLRQEWLNKLDLLVIFGGPMSVYQEWEHRWLVEEKAFVRNAIDRGKKVLGICLGAQMIADVLGAKVYRAPHKEIGWHQMTRTQERHPWLEHLPEQFVSFSWHGDTFELPEKARHLAFSEACPHQAFAYGDNVLALQFHLESTPRAIERMLTEWSYELREASYIQDAARIRSDLRRTVQSHGLLWGILDRIADYNRKG
jgi:GMP synthase-like glutamine amidotransferase